MSHRIPLLLTNASKFNSLVRSCLETIFNCDIKVVFTAIDMADPPLKYSHRIAITFLYQLFETITTSDENVSNIVTLIGKSPFPLRSEKQHELMKRKRENFLEKLSFVPIEEFDF